MTKYEILEWLKRMNLAFGGETAYPLEGGHTVHYTSIIADISTAVRKMETPPMKCKDCVHFEDAKVNAKGFLICPNTGMDIWDECYCAHGEKRIIEPQPDGIQFRTVDDLGRICLPKDIRDELGIKPGTECAVYSTDELTSDEIIVIRRK